MRNAIKRRLVLIIFLIITIMATIGHLSYAYNILQFAIPVLFAVLSLSCLSESMRKKSIEAFRRKGDSSVVGGGESCVWNLPIIFLLAAFGHWVLALLWLISWGILNGLRQDAIKEEV